MKKILFLIILSFTFFNNASAEELDCNDLNDCLSKNYTIKNKDTFQPHKQMLSMIYELERKREKKLIHCSITYRLVGVRTIPTESICFKP